MIQDLQKQDSNILTLESHLLKLLTIATTRDVQSTLQFLIQVQKLSKLNLEDQLLFFAEQNCKLVNCQTQLLQLLYSISQKVTITDLAYSYRFLRLCCKIEKSATDQVLSMNAKLLSERMLSQLGKSCQCYLLGKEQLNMQALIMFFIRIADGVQDYDFDDLYALKALGLIYFELANLLILLDPIIASLIKSNLSAILKNQLNKPILPIAKGQAIFKVIETLLLGNPEYFIDFIDTLKKHLFSNQHSIQKGLAYQTIVNCTNAFVEYLQNDTYKNVFYSLYQEITAETTIDNSVEPHKLQQIQKVVGHFVSLENIYSEYSDNKQILNFIAEFNLILSEYNIQPTLVLQKCIKKCMKNLLSRVEFQKVSQTYKNYIRIVDYEIRNSMILHLIQKHEIPFVVELLYIYEVSQLVWEAFVTQYITIKTENELLEQQMRNVILYDGFNISTIQTIILALLANQCFQFIIQLCNIYYDQLQFDQLLELLFFKVDKESNYHIIELMCSIVILKLDKSNAFEYNIFLKLIQMKTHNELMLHYLETISSKIESDQLLSLLAKCQPSHLIYTIINDNILNKELYESDWDLLLYIVQKQRIVDDQFYANLMDIIAPIQEYATALFNIITQQEIPSKLIFYMAQKIANQKYYNERVNQSLHFKFELKLEYLIELCQFTFQAAQCDTKFIAQQIGYFIELLDTQQGEFVEETTRVIKFYLNNFPNETCLQLIIPKYQYLYNQGKAELTQTLIFIVPDLIEVVEALMQQEIKEEVCQLFSKLIQLPLYAEFAECIDKYQIKFDLDPQCKLFNRFRNYQQFSQVMLQLQSLKPTSEWNNQILKRIE